MILSLVLTLSTLNLLIKWPPTTTSYSVVVECESAYRSSSGPIPPPGVKLTLAGRFRGECATLIAAFDAKGKELKREQRRFFAPDDPSTFNTEGLPE
jgi:hypothetical protein